MSFSCPHFDPSQDYCGLLKTDCVPGRRGCVLKGSVFAVPLEQRLQEREEENRQKTIQAILVGGEESELGRRGR
jgi:hypothetical protein